MNKSQNEPIGYFFSLTIKRGDFNSAQVVKCVFDSSKFKSPLPLWNAIWIERISSKAKHLTFLTVKQAWFNYHSSNMQRPVPCQGRYDHKNPNARQWTNCCISKVRSLEERRLARTYWFKIVVMDLQFASKEWKFLSARTELQRANMIKSYEYRQSSAWQKFRSGKEANIKKWLTLQLWPSCLAHSHGSCWKQRSLGWITHKDHPLTRPHWQSENISGGLPFCRLRFLIAFAIRVNSEFKKKVYLGYLTSLSSISIHPLPTMPSLMTVSKGTTINKKSVAIHII